MSDEAQEELAALYAVGLLTPEELAAFEAAMRADPELAALGSALQETAALLAYTVPQFEPPARVRIQLLEAVEREKRATFTGRFRSAGLIGWALAASLALVASLLGYERLQLRRELSELRNKDTLASIQIATLTSKLENGDLSVGSVAWDGQSNRGFLSVQKMPQLAANQDYQLWVIDPKYPQPINGGLVRVDNSGNAQLTFTVQVPIRSGDKFAISRERRGGALQNEGPIVMLSN